MVPPPVLLNFTVTTLFAGIETVTAPPKSVADVLPNLVLWLVTQAAAELGVKPEKLVWADCAAVPLFVKTTTTEPSVFWNAPMTTLVMDPLVATRLAPGRMCLDHMAKAQYGPEVEMVLPSAASSRCDPDCCWFVS